MRRSLLATGVFVVSACVVSSEGRHYPLTTGTWVFAWEDVLENSCFPLGVPVPHGIGIDVFVSVTGGSLIVAAPEGISGIPAMAGAQDAAGRFAAEGEATVVVTTACSLEVSTRASGAGAAPGLAGLVFEVVFEGSTGTDCSALEGETIDDFPFPALSDPASGNCSLLVKGLADFEEPWW